MDRLRTVVLGCGRMGQRRIRSLRSSQRFELVQVIDANPEKARTIAGEVGCAYGVDPSSVPRSGSVDVGVVCLPNALHYETAARLLDRGAHVFLEKPMTTSSALGGQLVARARQAGLRVQVGANARRFPSVRRVEEAVRRGDIGTPRLLRGWIGHDGWFLQASPWARDPLQLGGGALIDNGHHLIDLVRWIVGEPRAAMGSASQRTPGLAAGQEDNFMGLLELDGGARASIQASWTEPRGYLYFEVVGEGGYAVVDCTHGQDVARVARAGEPAEVTDFASAPHDSFDQELESFGLAIDRGTECAPSGEDGWQTLRTIEALYTSARTGGRVEIPRRGELDP